MDGVFFFSARRPVFQTRFKREVIPKPLIGNIEKAISEERHRRRRTSRFGPPDRSPRP
jgi:hypothetical protein